jgi:hypothetical protein
MHFEIFVLLAYLLAFYLRRGSKTRTESSQPAAPKPFLLRPAPRSVPHEPWSGRRSSNAGRKPAPHAVVIPMRPYPSSFLDDAG